VIKPRIALELDVVTNLVIGDFPEKVSHMHANSEVSEIGILGKSGPEAQILHPEPRAIEIEHGDVGAAICAHVVEKVDVAGTIVASHFKAVVGEEEASNFFAQCVICPGYVKELWRLLRGSLQSPMTGVNHQSQVVHEVETFWVIASHDRILIHQDIAVDLVADLARKVEDSAALGVDDVLDVGLHTVGATLNKHMDELPFFGQTADIEAIVARLLAKLHNSQATDTRIGQALGERDLGLRDNDRALGRHVYVVVG
jgi:hypothetical protein